MKRLFRYSLRNVFQMYGRNEDQQPKIHGSFQSKLRSIFGSTDQDQIMSEEEIRNQQEKKLQQQYFEMAKSIQNMQGDNDKLKMTLAGIYQDIRETIEKSYQNKSVQVILDLVPSKQLCHFAIEQFIGSITNPKNENVMNIFLTQAEKNCKTDEDRLEVEYYSIYLKKLQAIQSGNKEEFEKCNNQMIDLCSKEHAIAMHLTAKEMYKVALNTISGKHKKGKKELISEASRLILQIKDIKNQLIDQFLHVIRQFDIASQNGSYQSFYYLGEMSEQGDLKGGFDMKYAYECFLIAASFDNPKGYFKLAQYHKQGTVCEKNSELVYYYTKKAAELGLVEAQHNLGCIYMEKLIAPYDSVKALAWFTQAAAAGFPHSMYNAARLYLEGGQDGKVKVNMQAGLVWLEEVKKTGKIQVDDKIEEVVAVIEQMHRERRKRLRNKTTNNSAE